MRQRTPAGTKSNLEIGALTSLALEEDIERPRRIVQFHNEWPSFRPI
jgi:hypothetical protein